MKKIEKLLLRAYRMGQDSVSYMKVIPGGMGKPNHAAWCDDEPCKHEVKEEETSTTEDEMLKEILKK